MGYSNLTALAICVLAACSSTEHGVSSGSSSGAALTKRTVRVALCQIDVDGDRAAALDRIDAACLEAVELGAEVACFPETCLMGWVNPTAHNEAHPIPGATTDALGVIAKRHGLMLGVGLAEVEGGLLFDSAVLIDRDGTVLLRHRKVNILSELMTPAYTPGRDASGSVVETRLGRIGMLVCADTFMDDVVGQVAVGEPDLVLVPYGWAAPAEAWPDHASSLHSWIAHTARRVNAPVVGVDSTGELGHGPWTGYVLGGQSAAAAADGAMLQVLADRQPEVRVVEVELPARAGDSGANE